VGGFVLSCQCFENTSTFPCALSRPSSMQDRTKCPPHYPTCDTTLSRCRQHLKPSLPHAQHPERNNPQENSASRRHRLHHSAATQRRPEAGAQRRCRPLRYLRERRRGRQQHFHCPPQAASHPLASPPQLRHRPVQACSSASQSTR